jgi:hypothetical protein
VPIAQVVLQKPACHSTARSNRPSTRKTVEKCRTESQANKLPLERAPAVRARREECEEACGGSGGAETGGIVASAVEQRRSL